ncbi:unnamed protein product [Cladocopium goreaui]|uniref:Uncharacterized protein n=1 Tax=Cladocopium goreaui TaxID=2562237 RepID=A0A9P1FQD0_9DINO|nr:unnamed protein product [Cladocopium goreaui]
MIRMTQIGHPVAREVKGMAVPPSGPCGLGMQSPFPWTRLRSSRYFARRSKAKGRERLVSLGAAGLMSYWLMKLLKHSIINGIAWYLTAMRTGVPPPRRWKTFLATYAAVYVASTPLQPFKWATIAAMAPGMDRLMTKIASRFKWSKQRAGGLLLLVICLVAGSVWTLGVLLACSFAQIPLW